MYLCLGVIDMDLFQKIVVGVVVDVKVDVWILKWFGVGVDYLLFVVFLEGEYLKGLLL